MDLAIVWHFHQPVYKDPTNGEFVLPWVNYHATKNYHQMGELIRESGYPCTINFVPCLLAQIEEYAKGTAVDPYQSALEKEPGKLAFSDLRLLRKIVPGERDPGKVQDRALRAFFSPLSAGPAADRESLLALQKKILRDLIPRFRRLKDDGQIEVTTSPYYHPLLPVVFDGHCPPDEKLPARRFRRPEDGLAQIIRAREYSRKEFGEAPEGLWPSEGGVSREVARAVAGTGFRFALTDENVLWKSLNRPPDRKGLDHPYSAEGLALYFRDRELSDLLSFEYQKWPAREAVDDFLCRLGDRRKNSSGDSICVVVLDGENPWEAYPDNGVPFLRGLFGRLLETEWITPTFLSDHLDKVPPGPEITLVPGTWLGNFSKWVGSPAKNAAWDELDAAREVSGPVEEIFVAEGSDWFWWYDEPDKDEFDVLFKSYLHQAVLKAGGGPRP
jgi:alpha-amylase/alpha-mannosidase (GH57 family)